MKPYVFKPYRLLLILALVAITLSGYYAMLLYWLVFAFSIEGLNQLNFYKKDWRHLNWFFIGFLFFILAVRLIHWPWNPMVREVINLAEHLSFSLVVVLLIFMVLEWLQPSLFVFKKIALAIVLFNMIGVVNELYQNIISGRLINGFVSDSWKDLYVNFAGSLVAGIVLLFIQSKKLKKAGVASH